MEEILNKYKNDLRLAEKKERTITQYENYIKEYMDFASIKTIEDINKENLIAFKEEMQSKYKTNTVNIKITILNNFIDYLNLSKDLKLKHLKLQTKNTLEEVLTVSDYERLLRIAKARGKITMYYLMQTLAETGVRISELQHITVEAVKKGYTVFDSKGTVERTAFINKRLKKELMNYCKEYNITNGIIFKSKNGKPLDKAYIYKELQYIGGQARVRKSKVHAHSFRHLFANNYLSKANHNLVDLKNLLGHKSITTTQIYLQKSTKDLRATLED